jgi:predicted nucleotidyltransferase
MNMLKAEKDFEEFIGLLNKNKINYMIVGAYALALYAKPRNTGDLDIFIERSENNAKSMLKVLKEFGLESLEITKEDFMTEGRVLQLGVSPVRIDIMSSIDGIEFNTAFNRIEKVNFGSITANFISKEDLIKNKSSSKRKKDQADLEELQSGND